jgi:flotillin
MRGSDKVVLDEVELASNTPEGRERRKRWGFVSALPSEYLIVYRRGQLREKVSGQGARCFKWPNDTVAIVPTTLKEVLFRILDPLRIYRLVNFTNREQAESKLGRIIADTCRSTAKWLVANMTVEQCMRRRKEEIAAALRGEVARVVGSGDPAGWGVEIVTVDIQDIYIQDDQLFSAMQARFKAETEGAAAMARTTANQQVRNHAIGVERDLAEREQQLALEKARLKAEVDLEQSRRTAEVERERARLAAENEQAGLGQMKQTEAEKFGLDRFRVEENAGIALERVGAENTRESLAAEGRLARARIDAQAAETASRQEAEALARRLAAESAASPASIERLFMTQALPELAKTFAEAAHGMRFSVLQSAGEGSANATPMGFLLSQLLELLDQRLGRGAQVERRQVPSESTAAEPKGDR